MSIFNLKNTLIIDAITCITLFILCIFATATVVALLGLPSGVVTVAGWIGLASALLMIFAATRTPPSKGLANLIAVGNLGWVAASAAVLVIFWNQLSVLGVILVAVQAVVVLELAFLEARGAAQLPRPAAA